MAASVMSPNGVVCFLTSGIGGTESSSIGAAARDLRDAVALLRFRGEAFFVGDAGTLSSGSNISDGSTLSSVFLAFLFVGDGSVVFRRVWRLGLAFGAGVKSSSSSSFLIAATTTFFRAAAARLEGLAGDMADIVLQKLPHIQ